MELTKKQVTDATTQAAATALDLLHTQVAQIFLHANRREERCVRRWWDLNPCGGTCVVVRWIDNGVVTVAVAAGTSEEEQQATKPSEEAQWCSCTAYELPSLQ